MAVITAMLAVVVAAILVQPTTMRPGIARRGRQYKQHQAY
jgi:hypothetical protein